MGGSVIYDQNARRYYISIYWQGKRYKIFKHPLTGDPFFDKRSAEKQLGKIRTEIDEGYFQPKAWFPESPMSIRKYAMAWVDIIAVSAKTRRDYTGYIRNWIIPYFQDIDIRKIRYGDIVRFYQSIQLSEKSKYNIVSCLKTMFRHAWRSEDLPKMIPFPKLSFSLPEIEYLEFEQQEEILNFISKRDQPIFQIGMEYGLRTQEVRALKWDCVDLHKGIITIRRSFSDNTLKETTKTHLVRHDPLTIYARKVLVGVEKQISPFVFLRRDGKPYTNKNLNEIWKKASNNIGIKIKLQNAFRHSLGCQLLDQGADLDLVREQLGHTKSEMTRRYAKRKPVKRLEALELRRAKIIDLNKKRPVDGQ